jgi:hypothetical protein
MRRRATVRLHWLNAVFLFVLADGGKTAVRVCVAGVAGAVVLGARTLGRALPGPEARVLLLALLAVTLLHGVFNLWRQTALGDGARHRVTPRAIHHIL